MVITTHSMEEADALCDRIGIMAGGGLRCLGTQLYLKRRFGDGFKVSLTLESEAQRAGVEALMRLLSPAAKLVSEFGQQLVYALPIGPGGDVATIFNTLEKGKKKKGITEWGITQASLEEVFVKVVTNWENELVSKPEIAEIEGNSVSSIFTWQAAADATYNEEDTP